MKIRQLKDNKIIVLLYHQFRSLMRIAKRQTPAVPSFLSMTLDYDDVSIAKQMLSKQPNWYDEKIVKKFENTFARWNGSKYAFAFIQGRVALSAAIYALQIKPEDEVIIPAYTCISVMNSLAFDKINIVYCDIELDTFGLDVNRLKEKITNKTKAIILHHLYGLVCRDYEAIISLAKKCNIRVIEDCTHSTGAKYNGIRVGNRGDISFYSSGASKVFNTIAGGIVATNDASLAAGLEQYYDKTPFPDLASVKKHLRNIILDYYQYKHHLSWLWGDFVELLFGRARVAMSTEDEKNGVKPSLYRQRMPAALALIGLNQLKKIDKYNQIRRKNANRWDLWAKNNGYKKPLIVKGSVPVFLMYPLLVEPKKKQIRSWGPKKLGVEIGIVFGENCYTKKIKGCPNTDTVINQVINLPTLLGESVSS
ncbi:MAG: aminotransferase class I/II-fold pyridoxal phosphate-dependent enzyme [Actinobacteria bacterium]|nr:MAG: aminotransferase class I/II-fold pyridoxal phosphate-dependent enzyme [Actinomycetota bacterium]